MIDARAFIDTLATYTKSTDEKSATRIPRLATVDPAYVSGAPRVVFEGSANLSPNGFMFIPGYSPAPGDRVAMLPMGNTYIILGALTNEPPAPEVVPAPFGHAGITNGFQAVSAANGAYVTLASQVLKNGMTLSSNGLAVPKDGLYEIVAKGYFTGGTAYQAQYGATINSTALPPGAIASGLGMTWKPDASDYTGWSVVRRQLSAGDVIRLYQKGAASAWGTDGYNGSFLEVLYIQP